MRRGTRSGKRFRSIESKVLWMSPSTIARGKPRKFQRLRRAALRPEAEARRLEVRLENRLELELHALARRSARRRCALGVSTALRPDSVREDGTLPFRAWPSAHALRRTQEVSCTPPDPGAGCCLRRARIGSATSRLRMLLRRGCKIHGRASGLRRCSPPGRHAPRRGRSRRPARPAGALPATGACSGALAPGGTRTRWSCAASGARHPIESRCTRAGRQTRARASRKTEPHATRPARDVQVAC